ncbi:stalk domain-containing protein [Paenibacillus antarcticus]|uniref:Copper amine oxidase-like N-terminal domain-containing protein n=1 Tax=Paenibacillus antarcticus TaxID=253703 RepID=A0A162QDN9_9BACL|nr:stalk domain-containing protein [Paenibacillus antarcticus]OAB47030.1 hypothetical protein PBAT_08190 [Paenibacillus antarcticus]
MQHTSQLRYFSRKIGTIGLLLLVSMGSATSVIHADKPFQITVDGAWIQGEGTSFQRNGTIMVPIRVVAEAIGATVTWIPKERKIIVYKGEHNVQFLVGSKQALINTKEEEILEVPEIREGKVFIPLRIAMESMGATIGWDASNHTAAIESFLSPKDAKVQIATIADKTMLAIKNKDFTTLSNLSSREHGILFAPYNYIDQKRNIVIPHEKIAEGFNNTKTYLWGTEDGTGDPISMTFESYYKRFVYSNDFASAPKVGYNQTLGLGNSLNNVRMIYPESIVVEYYFDGFDPKFEEMDWKSLRLVFEKEANTWVLVAILHNQWTI